MVNALEENDDKIEPHHYRSLSDCYYELANFKKSTHLD